MCKDILKISIALDFAAKTHIHQRRKGELAEPYVNHLTDVARMLAEATEGHDTTLIIAGLLHDTIEDHNVSQEELTRLFSREVTDLVLEVTDDMTIPKPQRKLLQVANAPLKSPRAKMLRIADKTSNLNSVLTSAPPYWSIERRREYFEWAKRVVDGCRGVNAHLEVLFDAAYQKRSLIQPLSTAE
jgi:guanosine-3',5'-bis(diphosphate) 3'-pyrophosphohydrolase